MIYLSNAFSLNMLSASSGQINYSPLSVDEVMKIMLHNNCVTSAVGHEPTAAVFTSLLKREVKFNRLTVELKQNDTLLVGQYKGPRLEEGTMILPEGANITWVKITLGDFHPKLF